MRLRASRSRRCRRCFIRRRSNGDLTLHGVTRSQPIAARVALLGSMLRASGDFTLSQSDYNIKLVSVAGGALKLKDELKFSFEIVARRQE